MKGRHASGKAYRGGDLAHGDYGLKAMECGPSHGSRQIEAGRRIAMTRFIKRSGKIWIRVFPDKPVTKKPAETRMGHGKGNVEEWHAVIQAPAASFTRWKASPTRSPSRRSGSLPSKCRCRPKSSTVLPRRCKRRRENPWPLPTNCVK